MEHHSNIVPWQMVAEQTGAVLKYILVDEQGVFHWENAIGPKTKIVALAHVSNVTGTVNPIASLSRAAHMPEPSSLSTAPRASSMAVDVQELDCDFYAFSGHKCYGPSGIGILMAKKNFSKRCRRSKAAGT